MRLMDLEMNTEKKNKKEKKEREREILGFGTRKPKKK